MKTLTSKYLRVVALSASLGLPTLAFADDSMSSESTTTTTTSAGTVSDFSPDAMTVRTTSTTAPTSYTFTKTTTYVDENGNPVSVDVVRSGVPVTVFYTHDGDRMVASKVIVRKTTTTTEPVPVAVPAPTTVIEKKTTTTTTSSTSNQ
jgi:hypothetical protein